MKTRALLLLSLFFPFLTISLHASDVQVGNCLSGVTSYGSITSAIQAVPAGSTVNVCPGTYFEQLTIVKSLTLQGVETLGPGFPQLLSPPNGLIRNVTSPTYGSIAAQVGITGAEVNVKNLNITNTTGALGCPVGTNGQFEVGVYYLQSSGTLSHVDAYGEVPGGCGIGILAESTKSAQSVTVQNSTVFNFDLIGIAAVNFSPGTLRESVKGNYIQTGTTPQTANSSTIGIAPGGGTSATITGNVIQVQAIGIKASTDTDTTVSGNTIIGSTDGIDVYNGPANVAGNQLINLSNGVNLQSAGGKVSGNHFDLVLNGILNQCLANTLTQNVIDGASVGIASPIPSLTSGNTFFNSYREEVPCP
jgi:hypothetical protein